MINESGYFEIDVPDRFHWSSKSRFSRYSDKPWASESQTNQRNQFVDLSTLHPNQLPHVQV